MYGFKKSMHVWLWLRFWVLALHDGMLDGVWGASNLDLFGLQGLGKSIVIAMQREYDLES
jgi:hypothetical protein